MNAQPLGSKTPKADPPKLVALAGANGSGKSTAARRVLRGALRVDEFVNADTIAQGLSAFEPQTMGIVAGRIMLTRLRELAIQRVDFAFETTLASRSFAPWIVRQLSTGYQFHLVFLWLPSADVAIERVSERVRRGGHAVPEDTIRRRYAAGLKNFFTLYRPLAATWQMFDNSQGSPRLIATGFQEKIDKVHDQSLWRHIESSTP